MKCSFFTRLRDRLDKSERAYLALCFLLPMFLTWLCYVAHGTYPIGEESVLVLDLNGQYVSFFEALRSLIRGGGSLVYSWERALGGEFMGIYAYYLASPWSIIVALFPKAHITEALLVMFLIKSGLCGLTFGTFLHHTFRMRADIAHRPSRSASIIFSTLYAMSAYAIIQAHNTMWIDELYILPLLALGVERLIRRRNYTLYAASLALAIIVNFYIGYMMCIFTLFYFFYCYFTMPAELRNPDCEKRHFALSLCRIGVLSVIAIAIAAVIILPSYYSLTFGKTTFSDPVYEFTQRFDFADLLVKFYPGSYDTVRPEGLPFVYCGTLSLILLPVFFLSKRVRLREKIWGAAALIFFTFCFDISVVDLIWHGFQKPNWLNYRYSFMLIFFVLIFAYRAYCGVVARETDIRCVLYVGGALLLFIIIIQKLGVEFVEDFSCVWFSVLAIVILCSALGAVYQYGAGMGRSAGVLMTAIISVEMIAAGTIAIYDLDEDVVYTSRTTYVNYMDKISPLIDRITASDTSFYRLEKEFHRKTNDPMALGYRGLSNSTSTLNSSVITLLNRYGLTSKSNWSKYLGGTSVSDTLFGLKYVIYDAEHHELFYTPYDSDPENELYGYYNPYALSVAYASSNAIETLDASEAENPFVLMNETVTALLGDEDTIGLFKSVRATDLDYDNCDITYVTGHKKYTPEIEGRGARLTFKITGAGLENELFVFVPTEYPRECTVRVNGEEVCKILGNDSDCIHSLGFFEKGEEIIVSIALEEDVCYIANGSDYFYYLDTELFRETMPRLADGNYTVEKYSDTALSGHVTMPENMTTLFTTIPYDDGWSVSVDGENVPILKTLDSLLAVNASAGEHEVSFTYCPKCVTYGVILCLAGLVMFALAVVYDILRVRRRGEYDAIAPDIGELADTSDSSSAAPDELPCVGEDIADGSDSPPEDGANADSDSAESIKNEKTERNNDIQ
ncbi:MAG: YfhO family protein [Eubacteriales bacterium]